MMQTDTIKLLSATIVAMILAIGGPILLVWVFVNASTIEGSQGLIALLASFATYGTQFLFSRDTTAAARGQTRTDLLTPVPDQPTA